MASESRRHTIAGEAEREPVSENVAVGSVVHELDSEMVALVDQDEESLSLTTRESDDELVTVSVIGRLDVAIEENVPVNVAL